MSLFNRIKNIIRSNINSKGGFRCDWNYSGVEFSSEESGNSENEQYSSDNSDDSVYQRQNEEPTLEQKYYANLELSYGAGFDDIKKSYKRLLKKYHPDKFYGDEKKLEIAQNVVKQLNEAYEYFCSKYNK